MKYKIAIPVADPGFSGGGAPTPKVAVLTYYFTNSAEIYVKIKEFGPRKARIPGDPLGSVNAFDSVILLQ